MAGILWFKEITKADVGKVGGKGANLGEMSHFGMPVPPGFVVSSGIYENFIKKNGIDRLILEETKGLDPENSKKLNEVARTVQKAILKGKIDQEVVDDVSAAYRKLGAENYVAVRSSATAEDSPEASFAGQQVTLLNVLGESELIEALQRCWGSLYEPRSVYYRVVNHFDHLKVSIAVVVQKMIQSEISGVAFSLDPVSNDQSKIDIQAAYGLGEVVVSGAVSPDQYLVDKKTFKIVDKKIAKQTWTIKKSGKTNKRVRISYADREKQKLPDELIIKLANYVAKVERHYGVPQDLEWAVENGALYLVQTRPVTTLKQKGAGGAVSGVNHRVILKGSAASVGVASGKVVIIKSANELNRVNKGDVLVAQMTNPSYVPAMKRASAIVTDQGGSTSHAAIVSRELAIPCVVGTSEATKKLEDGDVITVDGEAGLVYEGNVVIKGAAAASEDLSKLAKTKTLVYVNLAEVEAAERVAKLPCDGVGLLRAEFMIADIGEHPRAMMEKGQGKKFVNELARKITIFAKNFSSRPVIYRATDFKTNEYKNLKGGAKYEREEANPMIGYRGAFRYLKEPDLFDLELQAIKLVRQKYKNLHLMIPFVRTVAEMAKVREIIEKSGLKRGEHFKLYLMCEVPSTVILAEEFIKLGIDGFSIGSNDLTQLTLGLDRDNEIVAEEFDERNEAVTRSIKNVIRTCRRHKVACSICGQAPSIYPEYTEMLVKEGITSISVNPDMIVKTKILVAEVEKKIK